MARKLYVMLANRGQHSWLNEVPVVEAATLRQLLMLCVRPSTATWSTGNVACVK